MPEPRRKKNQPGLGLHGVSLALVWHRVWAALVLATRRVTFPRPRSASAQNPLTKHAAQRSRRRVLTTISAGSRQHHLVGKKNPRLQRGILF
jgi:hypothetical protein